MRDKVSILHIHNAKTPQVAEYVSIYSQTDLANIQEDSNAIYLLNIHLNWDGRTLSSDYGFDVANWLRTYKKSLSPIIFYSFISKDYFEYKSKTSIKYKLLFGRGSAFVEAPFTESTLIDAIEETYRLSKSSLHDVITMLADIKGLVLDKLNHNLKFGQDVLTPFDEVEPLLTERQKALISFEENRLEIGSSNDQGDEQKFHHKKETFLNICNATLTEGARDTGAAVHARYKILILEDEKVELEKAKANLTDHFSVIATHDAEEATQILRSDTANEILVVISDWRLYRDPSRTYWQKFQGYEVLETASKSGYRSLFALTSQADFVVHHIRNAADFKFHLVKKQHLRSPEQWALFSDMVSAGCNDAISVISTMPTSKNWIKDASGISYKELYIQKKQSLEAGAFFGSILTKADEIWNYITVESKNNFKNIKLIKELFGLEVPRTKLNLYVVLVLRLIWIGLWYKLNSEFGDRESDDLENKLVVKVYKIICTGNYGYPSDNDVRVEMNKVCLTERDLQQSKMLPHERSWLLQKNLIK